MTKTVNKIPLNLELYEDYQIPQTYMAYTVQFNHLDDSECENVEYEYTITGYKIFHSEMERGNSGKFNLKLIIAKSELTF
jgi:hypothetical protein